MQRVHSSVALTHGAATVPLERVADYILYPRSAGSVFEVVPEALRGVEDQKEITPADLNACLDVVAAKGTKGSPAKRKARQRYRVELEEAGVLEPVEDDNGKVAFYHFHDISAG